MLDQLSANLFKCLRLMDDEANTPSGYCTHAGLIDYSSYKSIQGKKYETCWNNRLAELLTAFGYCVSREHYYPDSRKKCDLLVHTNEKKIWLEVKAAWKCWFSSTTGKIKTNKALYNKYLFGDVSKTHSAAGDIKKLETLKIENADYAALLIIGFDTVCDSINPDIEKLMENHRFSENDWRLFGPAIWPDHNQPNCRCNCWVLGKEICSKKRMDG